MDLVPDFKNGGRCYLAYLVVVCRFFTGTDTQSQRYFPQATSICFETSLQLKHNLIFDSDRSIETYGLATSTAEVMAWHELGARVDA